MHKGFLQSEDLSKEKNYKEQNHVKESLGCCRRRPLRSGVQDMTWIQNSRVDDQLTVPRPNILCLSVDKDIGKIA